MNRTAGYAAFIAIGLATALFAPDLMIPLYLAIAVAWDGLPGKEEW